MPFDPFFSSAHKDDFITSPEGRALYNELKAMPRWECKKIMWEWKHREMTQAEKDARRLIARDLNTKYSCRNKRVGERHAKKRGAAQFATGTIVYRGYVTDGSMSGLNKHPRGHK